MRQQRITTSQQEIYLIYLSEHQEFAASKISDDEEGGSFEEQWEELSKLLNATLGPKKSVQEWKTVFMHFKNQLKTRAKKLKSMQDEAHSHEANAALQKLTDIEKRALKLWKEDFQDKDIASILKEIEKTDITIMPVRKKRKSTSESDVVVTKLKIPAAVSNPIPVPLPFKVPITITPKQRNELSDFLNIKVESVESSDARRSTNNVDLRQPKEIQVQDILCWAKTYKVSGPAVDALFNVLKVDRTKTEIKQEPIAFGAREAQTSSLFNRVFARLDKMENNLVQKISTIERKMDIRNLNPIRVYQNTNNLASNNTALASKRE